MSLKLICGPAGSGKTAAAGEAFVAALKRGGSPVFIAPSGPDARHFKRRLLHREDLPVIAGGTVTTFEALCGDVLKEAGLKKKVLSDTERFMLLRAVVDGTGRHFINLSGASRFDGFIDVLGELFSELMMLGIRPEDMGSALRSWAGGDRWRQGLNKDLYRLYQGYRCALDDRGVHDRELAQRLALEYLQREPGLLGHETVVVDGFWDFTPLQHEFLSLFAGVAAELLVTLPYQPDKAALRASAPHFTKLAGGATPVYLKRPAAPEKPLPLARLEEYLFEDEAPRQGPAPEPAGDALVTLAAAGERGQAELVAAEILKLAHAGQSLDDIAVVCRSAGADAMAIAAACEDFGVPYEFAAPVPLPMTAVGRTALALLDCVDGDSRASLLAYLRSPLPVADASLVDSLDLEARSKGIEEHGELARAWRWLGGRPLEEIAHLKGAAADGISALGEEFYAVMKDLVSRDARAGSGNAGELGIDVLSLGALAAICHEAAHSQEALATITEGGAAAAKGTDDPGAASRFLKSSIRAASVRPPFGRRRGCVRLLDPHRILNQSFDVVFICGLVEGRFPSLGREDVFFSDAARRELNERCGLSLDAHGRRLDEERFLFHRSLSRARNRVYLCWPYCDAAGRPTVRSLFVDDALDLFAEGSWTRVEKDIGSLTFSPDQAPTAAQALRSLALLAAGGDGPPVAAAALKAAAAPADLDGRLGEILKASEETETSIRDPEILKTMKERDTFRVTELERYTGCPFRYFLEKVVRPRIPEPERQHLLKGEIFHDILCEFSRRMFRAGIYSLAEADAEQLAEARRQLAAITTGEFERRGLGPGLQADILKVEVRHHLDRYIDREHACGRGFRQYGYEMEFGSEKTGRFAMAEMLSLGGISLKGRLDRIDVREGTNLAVVIDYKGAKKAKPHKKFEEEGIIQIPLYMKAAREIWGLEPVAGEYYPLLGNGRRGLYHKEHADLLDGDCGYVKKNDFTGEETFRETLAKAEAMALAAAAGIRAGDFDREPIKTDVCDRCDYPGICRYPQSSPGAGTGGDNG